MTTSIATKNALPRLKNFGEFWAFYLSEHLTPGCRALHYVGFTIGATLFVRFLFHSSTVSGILSIPTAYAFAWLGHFLLERNRPATWRYPLWSLRAEMKMSFFALTGLLRGEYARLGLDFGR